MPLPYIGPVSLDNISGDMPRAHYGYTTFAIPGVNGTGTSVEGERFADQSFRCTAFCVNQAAVILLKNVMEPLQMTVVEICNSLGEVWANCLILQVEFPPDSTIGVEALNVPNGDGTYRPLCTRKVDFNVLVRFQYD